MQNGGAAVVLLADDDDTIALRRTMRAAGMTLPVPYASDTLRRLFDNAKHAPERRSYRVQFALPSFLVVNANGVVTHRETGIPLDELSGGQPSQFLVHALTVVGHRPAPPPTST